VKTLKKTKKRIEENGLFIENSDHFEMFEKTIYLNLEHSRAYVLIPFDVVRHLKLENKDKVLIAIRKIQT